MISVKRLVTLAFLVGCASVFHAQEVQIRVVNARNGKPISGECLNVWIGMRRNSHFIAGTNRDGVAALRLSDTEVAAEEACRGWNRSVSKSSDDIRVTGEFYVVCQEYAKSIPGDTTTNPLPRIPSYSIKKILDAGVVAANTCGKIKSEDKPGVLVLFARPMTFWEKLRL